MSEEGPDLGKLLEQAQQMQEQLLAAQAAAADATLEGQSGGGVVRITMTGAGEFTGVKIAPEVVNADEVDLLEDLVLAALHDVMLRMHELQQASLGQMGLGGGLGGLLGEEAE